MLKSPTPNNHGLDKNINPAVRTDQLLSIRKDAVQRQSSIMATETKFTELRDDGAPKAALPPEPVLELRSIDGIQLEDEEDKISTVTDGLLSDSPPGRKRFDAGFSTPTHPHFPPLPSYGPPSTFDAIGYLAVRIISFILSLLFLGVIVAGAAVHGVGGFIIKIYRQLTGRDPQTQREFYAEEQARKLERKKASRKWKRRQQKREVDEEVPDECPPLEGGKDPVVSDVAYYARRVGLDVETFKVQTEDGFLLTLWHIYNPQEYTSLPAGEREHRGPYVFTGRKHQRTPVYSRRKYPVLMMHGLLQNSGAYCANDDESLAFFLCKSGYDVWLGNNRCGLDPEHATLSASDPRMWTWNIQHMGVLDLAALISRVLYETGFEKLGLVCHSQGTAQTFVALAKEQRPELGTRISVFCALAPAVYAGPLVDRIYFRFMRIISPRTFRLFFGVHSFIPLMLTAQRSLHARVYGPLGYMVFSFLFDWSDRRWDRELRDRMFQFAPVYVSTETIRWWLGADGFSTQKCILGTVAEIEQERLVTIGQSPSRSSLSEGAWYGPTTPPFALWVGGKDRLVDGRRLLQRLNGGREPHVQVVHAKVIEEYEHLDVLWAMDMVEQVGREVRQVLWATMPAAARAISVTPRGVE